MSKSPVTEERLLDGAKGWREEAEAVIADISSMVNSITISSILPCDESGIYLNVETKENSSFTIEMSTAGFRVCGNQLDLIEENDDQEKIYYETPYALLDSISPAYRYELNLIHHLIFVQSLDIVLEQL